MSDTTKSIDKSSWHRLRLLIVATLILLTIQGWFGDTVNLFAIPTSPVTVESSANGVFQAIVNVGPTLILHTFIGLAILALGIVVLSFSLKSKPRNIQIPAILGLVMVISAIIGGTLFVLSGYTNNGVSAQMGGSYIGAYAFYFIELYFSK